MFENCKYQSQLQRIYRAYSQWVIAFADYVNQTKEMRTTYNEIALTRATKDARARLADHTSSAVNEITAAGLEMQREISSTWALNPLSYDEKAVAMWSSPYIKPTAEDLEHAAEKYEKNATMLSVLHEIAEQRGLLAEISVGSPLYYASRAKKLDAAASLTREVAALCNTDDPVLLASRQSFADNFERFEESKLKVIGLI